MNLYRQEVFLENAAAVVWRLYNAPEAAKAGSLPPHKA